MARYSSVQPAKGVNASCCVSSAHGWASWQSFICGARSAIESYKGFHSGDGSRCSGGEYPVLREEKKEYEDKFLRNF